MRLTYTIFSYLYPWGYGYFRDQPIIFQRKIPSYAFMIIHDQGGCGSGFGYLDWIRIKKKKIGPVFYAVFLEGHNPTLEEKTGSGLFFTVSPNPDLGSLNTDPEPCPWPGIRLTVGVDIVLVYRRSRMRLLRGFKITKASPESVTGPTRVSTTKVATFLDSRGPGNPTGGPAGNLNTRIAKRKFLVINWNEKYCIDKEFIFLYESIKYTYTIRIILRIFVVPLR